MLLHFLSAFLLLFEDDAAFDDSLEDFVVSLSEPDDSDWELDLVHMRSV